MAKKITVLGTGYVGLVSAVGLADFGNTVIGVDLDSEKIESLREGIPTIYEQGLKEYLERNLKSGRLSFTTDIDEAVMEAEVVFIAVGTPSNTDGDADLSQIDSVIRQIANNLNSYKVIVTKSTVPVGTNRWICNEIKKRSGKGEFSVVSNPEFLREGKAVHDFFHPDRIVIGYEDNRARAVVEDIYRTLYLIQTPFIWCNWETAELIKYASNAFLATKITFINQIANLSEAVGADIHQIAKAMGMDGRISPKFLHPGPGYGGSCFPKDTQAIVKFGDSVDVDMRLVKEVVRSNQLQKVRMVEKIKKLIPDLKGKTIAVLGLAFKAETDDVRESPAITIIDKLIETGATINVHDPKAIENFKKIFEDKLNYYIDPFIALQGCSCLVICTEWNEYRNLDLEKAREMMKELIILDTRNVLDPDKAEKLGFIYDGVGRS